MYRFDKIHLPEYNLQPLHEMAIYTGSLVTIVSAWLIYA